MTFLLSIFGLLIPRAFAASIDELGQGIWGSAPGIDAMWSSIRDLFPFTGEGADAPGTLLDTINTAVLAIIALVAVALVVYAGIRMIAGGGNEEGFTEAKKILKNVAIGLLCAMLADVVIMYIADFVTKAAGGQ